jgi:hypothetical protein
MSKKRVGEVQIRGDCGFSICLALTFLFLLMIITTVSAERLPTVGADNNDWGPILNGYLFQALGANATTLNIVENGFIGGNLSVLDLTVRSGQSIHLAGATFSNEGHYTSVDTNWIIENKDDPTSFLGVYATNESNHSEAYFIAQNANNYSINIIKFAQDHPDGLSNEGMIVNDGGDFGIFVDHDKTFSIGHFDNLTKDKYGEILNFSGKVDILTLNETHFALRKANIISLAGANLETRGHYTSIDTNWIIEEDDQPSAFMGVYANNDSLTTNAHIVLEAMNSSLVIIKNSPNHPLSPNSSGIINEKGNFATFVAHDKEIIWFHYDNMSKDAFGNILNITGAERQMTLNKTMLKLEGADLSIGGIILADYNISVGNVTFTGISVNEDFGVIKTENGSTILSVTNYDTNPLSSALLAISDFDQHGLSLFKFNSNNALPELGAIVNNRGKLKILGWEDSNVNKTGIEFGFIDDFILDKELEVIGFANETKVMEIYNDSVTVFTDFYIDGNVNIKGVSLNNLIFNLIVGYTNSSYNGNITNGSLIGYVAANAICNAEYSGSHFCLKSEILKTIANGNTNFTGEVWFANGPPGYTAPANDCEGWTKVTNEIGPFWDWDENDGAGSGQLTPCSSELQLACCG